MDISEILAGNAGFATGSSHVGLRMMPRKGLMLITCADPRLDAEKILGLELGDAAVVRNIGGRVTAPTLDTLAGLAAVGRLQARRLAAAGMVPPPGANQGIDVVVLQHTDCGILRLAEEPESLARFLGTDLDHLGHMHVTDPHAAVDHDVSVLRDAEPLPGMRVWGMVYDVATGLVEVTHSPEPVAA